MAITLAAVVHDRRRIARLITKGRGPSVPGPLDIGSTIGLDGHQARAEPFRTMTDQRCLYTILRAPRERLEDLLMEHVAPVVGDLSRV